MKAGLDNKKMWESLIKSSTDLKNGGCLTLVTHIQTALKEQGFELKDGEIVPMNDILEESDNEKTRKKLTEIMRDKELATCHEAFDTYGMENNCGFLMEECGELLSAVNKLRRGRVKKDAVFEELADVQLVITAFATHLGYRRFLEVKDAKLQKLARNIGEIKELEDAKRRI